MGWCWRDGNDEIYVDPARKGPALRCSFKLEALLNFLNVDITRLEFTQSAFAVVDSIVLISDGPQLVMRPAAVGRLAIRKTRHFPNTFRQLTNPHGPNNPQAHEDALDWNHFVVKGEIRINNALFLHLANME